MEWIVVPPLHGLEVRLDQRKGLESGLGGVGNGRAQLARLFEMPAGDGARIGKSTLESRPAAPGHDILAHHPVTGQDVGREENLPLPRMMREGTQ